METNARIRVVLLSTESHERSVAHLVRSLLDEGRRVLYVTANRPYRTLAAALRQAGLDPDALRFVDVVSSLNGSIPAERPENVRFVRSPTMLEMIAMRAEQDVQGPGPCTHVLVDSLNALAIYNGPRPVQEFAHFLVNRMRGRQTGLDLLVSDSEEGRSLGDLVSGFVDERMHLNGVAP